MGDVDLTLGPLHLDGFDDFGVEWTTAELPGWGGAGSTLTLLQKPRSHGAWAGKAYYRPRHLSPRGLIIAPTQAALSAAIDRLNDACSLDDTLLTVAEQGRSRWCIVRREDEVLAPMLTSTLAAWSIQVAAPDPRKMGDPVTGSTRLPATSGGLMVPFTVPFSIDATVTSGQISLTNPGNTTGPVTLRIDGPCSGPVVTHRGPSGTVQTLAFTWLGLAAGEWLDIDMDAQTVLGNGQANRATWLTSRQWSGFDPGVNTWGFSAASYTSGAFLTVTATPADQ